MSTEGTTKHKWWNRREWEESGGNAEGREAETDGIISGGGSDGANFKPAALVDFFVGLVLNESWILF